MVKTEEVYLEYPLYVLGMVVFISHGACYFVT